MPTKKLDFKAGQYVVYPTQGVGKLLRVEEQTIGDQKIKMMVIDFERSHMTLRVPLERAELSGLRPLSSAKKMDEAIASAKVSFLLSNSWIRLFFSDQPLSI